jgi:hypothetical protein
MKFILTESKLNDIVSKILNSGKNILPKESSSTIIRRYIKENPDIDIKDLVFTKLDSYDFKMVKHKFYHPNDKLDDLYFVNDLDDDQAVISYNLSDGWCYVDVKLMKKIDNFFDGFFVSSDIKKIIGEWVESKIPGYKVTDVDIEGVWYYRELIRGTD